MKRYLLSVMLVSMSSLANAWTCEARSLSAVGIGVAGLPREAATIALYHCQMRSPSGEVCYVVRCY